MSDRFKILIEPHIQEKSRMSESSPGADTGEGGAGAPPPWSLERGARGANIYLYFFQSSQKARV